MKIYTDETQPLIIHGSDDVFEITDFTVVSDSEQFIITFENCLHDLNLGGTNCSGVKRLKSSQIPMNVEHLWKHVSKLLPYPPTRNFFLTHVWLDGLPELDTNSVNDPYPAATSDLLLTENCFYRWSLITAQFGVFEYLLLSPVDEKKDIIITHDDLQMIRSAVETATANVFCSLPVFIQFGNCDNAFYVGSATNGSITTEFDTISTSSSIQKFSCLHGILELFSEKLIEGLQPKFELTVTIELEYVIKPAFHHTTNNNSDGKNSQTLELSSFLMGTKCDVVKEFFLLTSWPGLRPETVTDTISYSDLDPHSAPRWKASVSFNRNITGMLAESIQRTYAIAYEKDSYFVKDLLCGYVDSMSHNDPFRNIADHVHNQEIHFVETTIPIDVTQLNLCMDQIFSNNEESWKNSTSTCNELFYFYDRQLHSAKSAPCGNVVFKLAVALSSMLLQFDTAKKRAIAAAQIWNAFVERLRFYWENVTNIPGFEETETPDLSKCLLFQKVQMIQCCIVSRRKRHELFNVTKNFVSQDDEFYDANEDFSDLQNKISDDVFNEKNGRLQKLGNVTLIDYPDRPLYEPFTQNQCPMTEDVIEKHAAYLQSINETERVKAQLCTLESDMQAFKAANPGCCIIDFVRWHSPHDVIVDIDRTCRLSERMSMKDNIWQKTWDNARAVSVAHQTRMFNENREAEQILQYFSLLKLSEVFKLILPISNVAVIYKLLETATQQHYSLIRTELNQAVDNVCRLSCAPNYDEALNYLQVVNKVEELIIKYDALLKLFMFYVHNENKKEETFADDEMIIQNFVLDLMSSTTPNQAFIKGTSEFTIKPVTIVGAPNSFLAKTIQKLLCQSENIHDITISEVKFPQCSKKHFVITCVAPRDRGHLDMPQRLMVTVTNDRLQVFRSLTSNKNFVS